jgi:type II secretory pathway component GspD/PulD (secretin)
MLLKTNLTIHNPTVFSMKPTKLLLLSALLLPLQLCPAQSPEDPAAETTTSGEAQPVPDSSEPKPLILPTSNPTTATNKDGTPVEPQITASEEGYVLKQASLNEVFQALAKAAGRQYFHNAKIAGPEYAVTGHLNDGNPLQQMEELAFQYGLSLHTKGNTVYALSQAQLAQLPGQEFHYQLRYLRPSDIKQIQELIRPMLTPATGIVNFEPKTNTIVIIDSAHRIQQARQFLRGIDQPKGQIIVETKILRINSNAAERTGINWSTSLPRALTVDAMPADSAKTTARNPGGDR